ncbi:MYXO-CTERM sorting domain-containing protein [Corallococcus interemptor]|uniref:MYXO-CTERM sorting domain-containing protein n=1 Tax=Corallococcus interemptor TaxID=2316720 RepID=UPI0035D48A07
MRAVLVMGLWASVIGATELSNEFSLESPRYGRLPANVRAVRAATGGGVTLLVWSDDRRGDTSASPGFGPDIYATRIDAEGNVLDPAGIPLCTAPSAQEAPAVTWDGKQFLVAWSDNRERGRYAIYGARVSPDGTVTTPPDGFRISVPNPDADNLGEDSPRVAASGGVSLVVWQRATRTSSDYDLLGARIRDDGTVLDAPPRVLVSADGKQGSPSVAGGTGGFLVTWADGRHQVGEPQEWDVYATRVALSGEVLDAEGIPVSVVASSLQTQPQAVFDGTDYVVVWSDNRATPGYGDFYGGRVSLAGEPLDGTGVRITPANADLKREPALAFDGTQTWVAWRAITSDFDERIYAVRFGKDGVVKDTARVALITHPAQKQLHDLLFDGTWLRAVWTEKAGTLGVKSGRFETDGTGVDGEGRFVAWSANFQDQPSVASTGGTALMAWRDRSAGPSIRIQPLSAEGQPTGDVWVLPASTSVGRTAVGAGDDMYLVAWGEGTSVQDVRAQRVRADGTPVDAQPLSLATATLSGPASIASAGNTFFVVWEEAGHRITGVMVRADGSVSDPIHLPGPATLLERQLQPKVAFNGTHFLVVWANHDTSTYGVSNYAIHAARLSPTGQGVDATPLILSSAKLTQSEPGVAAHGDFLVTWSDSRTGGTWPEIRAARVADDGTLKSPEETVVVTGNAPRRFSQPMFDGSGFTVLWQEGSDANVGLKLARLSLDGALVTPAPLEVWRAQDTAQSAGIALLAPHKAVIVYQHFDSAPGLSVDRVHGRVLSITPDAGTDSPEEPEDSGCGCSSAGSPLWGLLPLALLLRRRRARAA